MFSSEKYMEMARECLEAADRETDDARKKTLVSTARLYTQAAMDSSSASRPAEFPAA